MVQERIFKSFPAESDLYSADVAPIIGYTTSRYGIDEWRAAVITNELHGHLGIYATIGDKMGIFAREQLGNPHHLKVISFAGDTPPVSCMNDGLQVSTGATIGHGLISIADNSAARPEAIFIDRERQLHLRLNDEKSQQIERDVRRGVELYGTQSPDYWRYIRRLAIEYWQSFDRNEIFDIVLDQ